MKPLTFAALRLLSDGVFHSGEVMARELGVSRASVFNAMRGLEGAGLQVYKVRGRGYCLPEPLQFLDPGAIRQALGGRAERFHIDVLDCVESTNSLLLQKAEQGAPGGSVVAAELQTRGRGRRGRPWHSGMGGALTFSLLWRFNLGAGSLSGLSLAAGVALVRALKSAGVDGVTLKWPNDVLHRLHKLAGILIELHGDMLGPSAAVIGIGLNLKLSEKVKAEIDQAVTDVYSITGGVPDRNALLARVLAELGEVLEQFERQGFSGLKEEWASHHAFQSKPVRILLPDGSSQQGTVAGVDDDGSLLLRTASGTRRFNSGELSLRGAS